MNTTTISETTAVQAASDKATQDAARQAQTVLDQARATAQADEAVPPETQAPVAELRFIALSRLRLSKRDVRKTAAPVDALAESIARVGLLQNLIVVPHPDGESFEVVAGGRRWAALRLLAKKKRIARDQTIPCLVVPEDSATVVSLTENVQRQDMHPADQFEAFLALVNEGRPIEDIAADFGVTPLVVQRRLKLARISPRLMAEYRKSGITLEQLMVLTLTDDHKIQEAAYFEVPTYEREPYALRRRLTHGDVDAARSPLARFVGGAEAAPAKTLSERLVRNLSAHRTAALQAELAKKPDVALAALVHRLALTVFYRGGDSVLQITVYPQDGLTQHAPELAEGKAAAEFDALRTGWRERLPADDADLFDVLRQMKRADLLALLAVCVAGTVDAVVRSEHDSRAEALAQAVKLDMSGYWQPTAEAYFNHVPEAQALAWFQAFKPAEVNRVAGYKKPDMAREASQHASGAKWLPDMLRTPT